MLFSSVVEGAEVAPDLASNWSRMMEAAYL